MDQRVGSVLAIGASVVFGLGLIGSAAHLSSAQMEFNATSTAEWNRDWKRERADAEAALIQAAYDQKQVECLAQNVYHESRGESEFGMVAVAAVTINRVNHKAWGDDVCGVVWQKAQFSWTLDRKLWKVNETGAYRRAKRVANAVYYGEIKDPTRGATHYHTTAINPRWSSSGVDRLVIGSHIFMKMASGGR